MKIKEDRDFCGYLKELAKKYQDVRLVITHTGGAHRDEVRTIMFFFALMDRVLPVERRDPTLEELEDPGVIIFDVGGRYEPQKNNFDHHQFEIVEERDPEECQCAFTLFGRECGLEELLQDEPWYRFTAIVDCLGYKKAAHYLGLAYLPAECRSPVEEAILDLIEEGEINESGWYFLKKIGQKTLQRIYNRKKKLPWFAKNAEFYYIPAQPEDIPVMYFEGKGDVKGYKEFGHVANQWLLQKVAVCIMPNNREDQDNGSMTLYRFRDDPRIDFSLLRNSPYRHQFKYLSCRGYVAKTRGKLTRRELIDMVRCSVKPEYRKSDKKKISKGE